MEKKHNLLSPNLYIYRKMHKCYIAGLNTLTIATVLLNVHNNVFNKLTMCIFQVYVSDHEAETINAETVKQFIDDYYSKTIVGRPLRP